MVDHLQLRVTPWRQYASHVKVRGTLSKMDVLVKFYGDNSSLIFDDVIATKNRSMLGGLPKTSPRADLQTGS